jgi:two-component system chemotaxis sensor kinase CheA
MEDFEKELKVGFLDEARQSSADVEQCFLALEENPEDEENLNKIFRLAHNLKGSSKAVGFDELGEFTHEFESFILKIKNKEFQASLNAINILLRANDHIREMVDGLTIDLGAKFDSSQLIADMKNYSENENSEPKAEVLKIENHETSNSQFNSNVVHVVEATIEVSGVEAETKTVIPIAAKTIVATEKSKKSSAPVDDSLRVSLSKIEYLVNAVGEMVILQSGLKEQATLLNSPSLKRIVQHLSKVSKEIQETSMALRMIPIKPLFQKMQRIVRDTSQTLKKDIEFQLEGENTDIDKTILERIGDPLVHLIRNSVDHGIESSELRKQKGKNPRGTVVLRALHQSGRLIIEVFDDGGGLDPEKLKKKAIEKGLISRDNKLTDKEAQNLIFAPGFSTKEQVTDVSGRGVGMDVVKTNIQELGGEVHIDSTVGCGATFKIVLPLTLAIVDAMIIAYGPDKFVIPLNQVHETLKVGPEVLKESSLGNTLFLRQENLPIFRLGDFFGIRTNKKNTEMIAIVVRSSVKTFAFLVDDIVGQSQVVLKQLGPELQGLTGISGSTILSDGKPAFIIEAQDLLKRKLIVPTSDSGQPKRISA